LGASLIAIVVLLYLYAEQMTKDVRESYLTNHFEDNFTSQQLSKHVKELIVQATYDVVLAEVYKNHSIIEEVNSDDDEDSEEAVEESSQDVLAEQDAQDKIEEKEEEKNIDDENFIAKNSSDDGDVGGDEEESYSNDDGEIVVSDSDDSNSDDSERDGSDSDDSDSVDSSDTSDTNSNSTNEEEDTNNMDEFRPSSQHSINCDEELQLARRNKSNTLKTSTPSGKQISSSTTVAHATTESICKNPTNSILSTVTDHKSKLCASITNTPAADQSLSLMISNSSTVTPFALPKDDAQQDLH
jgi:hypothetical protein